MQIKNPDYRKALEHGFATAQFVQANGAELQDCGPGWAHAVIEVTSQQMQHNRYIHGGLQATLAEHTAGAAVTTLIDAQQFVLAQDLHIYFLRPAEGELLICRAQVIKFSAHAATAEAELFALKEGAETPVAKAVVGLVVLGHE
jgi:uncharacterized protein (TIGR00369 family)